MSKPKHRSSGASAPPRVCFVTREFHGLFKNGGIGTATTSLALALAGRGFDVTVLIPSADDSGPRLQTGDFPTLQAEYGRLGVTLDYVRPHPHMDGSLDEPRTTSYCVFLHLRQASFDVVLFPDNGGLAYYSLLARHAGTFDAPPLLAVVAHGPLEWVNELNMTEFASRVDIATDHLERDSVRLADLLVSPSRYMLEWMVGRGWKLPARNLVIQNLVDVRGPEFVPAPGAQQVREIVFFGRMETRKGVPLFCDALHLLDERTDLSAVTVTFLGKFHRIAGVHSGVYVVERARRWKAAVRILAGYDQKEALEYLRRPGTLAVIPSRAENSPCVVAECLQLGYLFLATDSGGTAELIAPDDRGTCLFAPEPEALAQRMYEVLRSGQRPARLAVPQSESLSQWIDVLTPGRRRKTAEPRARPARVSACLVWSDCDEFAACLASLQHQDHRDLEIIVVALSGSGAPTSVPGTSGSGVAQRIPVHVCPQGITAHGAARAAAARLASGDLLLFVDEDTVTLCAGAVAAFALASARTGADILTAMRVLGPASRVARPAERRWAFPLGACLELGSLENCFGQGALLVKSQYFARSGGFASDCDTALADWVFMAQALLARASLELIPAALVEVRERRGGIAGGESGVENHRRVMRAYRDAPVGTLGRVLESLFDVPRENQLRVRQALEALPVTVRELIGRLSKLEPGSRESGRVFVEYCCERGAVDLALDFARHNDAGFLIEAIDAARRVTEQTALDALRTPRLELWHTVDLTAELAARAAAVSGVVESQLQRSQGGGLSCPAPAGNSVIRVGGACPPGAGSLLVSAVAEGGFVSLAVIAHEPAQPPTLGAEQLIAGARAWSGWTAAGELGAVTELSVLLSDPPTEPLDLLLLARRDAAATSGGTVTWQRLAASVQSVDRSRATAGRDETPAARLPQETLALGEVLTDMTGISIKIFRPGERTLLHPLPNRLALVRVPNALPPQARGLRCAVSVEHDKGHPVEFGLWVRPAASPARSAADLPEDDAFSGWLQVATPFRHHELVLQLPAPGNGAMDLYLATRVVGFPDVNFCHAFWHDFWIMA